MIHFEDVNYENWQTPLQVFPEQEEFAADRVNLLARAYACREQRSRAFLIYADDTAVGMGLYYDIDRVDSFFLSQLFIDCRYQGRGYGRLATELVLRLLKEDGKFPRVRLCCIDGNRVAMDLYTKLGFREFARNGKEIMMERSL